jgi:hypothetical protein
MTSDKNHLNRSFDLLCKLNREVPENELHSLRKELNVKNFQGPTFDEYLIFLEAESAMQN